MPVVIPSSLIDNIFKGRATLFLGSGASKEAGFPGIPEVIEYLASKAGPEYYEDLRTLTFDGIAEFLYGEEGYGKKWVKEKTIDLFNDKLKDISRPPSKAHEIITKIKWNRIFTTNYDNLIEISYESTMDSAQRLLTVVEPDLNLHTRSDDVVQLIKLNGCIIEAQRKAVHKLIFTFSEQQESKVYNKQFYEFLKTDAINGPIIFIGFSFTHPGATFSGTSLEFTVLENIIREFEGASNWHYCVIPYDENSVRGKAIKRKLQSNNIKLINMKFGEFIEEIHDKLGVHIESIHNKEPIKIKVKNTEFSIDYLEYKKDVRHFDLIGPHMWEESPPPVSDSLNGMENWSSYEKGHFIDRLVKDEFKEFLDRNLSDPPQIITFLAPVGWGKTSFLKQISIEYAKKGLPIFWLNQFSTIVTEEEENKVIMNKWDDKRIDRLMGLMYLTLRDQNINTDNFAPILIFDNMPEKVDEALNLFRTLNYNKRKFILIISLREGEYNLIKNDYPLIKHSKMYMPDLSDSKIETMNLIDFCVDNNVATLEGPEYKDLVTTRIMENEAENSLLLSLYIIYDKEHRPFSEIISGIYNSLQDEIEKKIVLLISSIQRINSGYYPRLYSIVRSFPNAMGNKIIDKVYSLIDRRILYSHYHNEEPCIRAHHSLIANEFINASKKNQLEIEDYLRDILDNMSANDHRDLTIIRSMLKQINDYKIKMSSEEAIYDIFEITAESTNHDWVVCHQYAKYLINRERLDLALAWNEIALVKNPKYPSLIHQQAHILQKLAFKKRDTDSLEIFQNRLNKARELFSLSRFGVEPNEYGFVTHLEMLLHLLDEETDQEIRANIIAEGAALYQDGLDKVSAEKYNLLLDPKFEVFKLNKFSKMMIMDKISDSLESGKASIYGTLYLSDYLYKKEGLEKSLAVLYKYRKYKPEGISSWVYEAKHLAHEGQYVRASTVLHSAKLRIHDAENTEGKWLLYYLDLIVSLIRKDYQRAKEALVNLIEGRYYPTTGLPKGYIWKDLTRDVDKRNRSLSEHALIFEGRVENVRTSGRYGRITLRNGLGEELYINFLPDSFGRDDIRSMDYVKFAVQIYYWGIRAESLNASPYLNTVDDYYVKEEPELEELNGEYIPKKRERKQGVSFEDIVRVRKVKYDS